MMPVTGMESAGGSRWTTPQEEAAFLHRLADETDLEVTVEGYSVLGNPIWCATIGQGSPMMVTANVHGYEPSGREAALRWLRDIAYSTDSEITTYLATHRVVVIPTVNPDGSFLPLQRFNGSGVDVGQRYMSMREPENRAVARVIQREQPVAILDCHEVGDDQGADWRPFSYSPNAHPDIAAQSDAIKNYISGVLAEDDYVTLDYQTNIVSWGAVHRVAHAWHAAGVLSEVAWRNKTREERTSIAAIALQSFYEYHRDNAAALDAAYVASRDAARTDDIFVPTGLRITSGEYVPGTGSYTIDGDVPAELFELHGIQWSGQTVPLDQPARLIAAYLLDPASSERIPNLAAWEPTPEGTPAVSEGRSKPILARVRHEGVIRPVKTAFVKQDGVLRPVSRAWVKRDGVLRSTG